MVSFKNFVALLGAVSFGVSESTHLIAKAPRRDLMVLETRDLVVRKEYKKTFDFGWQIKDRPIFSA